MGGGGTPGWMGGSGGGTLVKPGRGTPELNIFSGRGGTPGWIGGSGGVPLVKVGGGTPEPKIFSQKVTELGFSAGGYPWLGRWLRGYPW